MIIKSAGVIVLGYDGSDGANAALKEVADLATAYGDVVLVTFGYGVSPAGGETQDQERAVSDIGRSVGESALEQLGESGVTAELVLVPARPAEGLLQVAESRGARMIAVGFRGTGPMVGALLGSVTYQVVHRSRIPVLVCPALAAVTPR